MKKTYRLEDIEKLEVGDIVLEEVSYDSGTCNDFGIVTDINNRELCVFWLVGFGRGFGSLAEVNSDPMFKEHKKHLNYLPKKDFESFKAFVKKQYDITGFYLTEHSVSKNRLKRDCRKVIVLEKQETEINTLFEFDE